MKKTCGWYTFEDGYSAWYHGVSKAELMKEIKKHGKVVDFKPW